LDLEMLIPSWEAGYLTGIGIPGLRDDLVDMTNECFRQFGFLDHASGLEVSQRSDSIAPYLMRDGSL
jgi:hypothetical protein